jgi:hypothetical protein
LTIVPGSTAAERRQDGHLSSFAEAHIDPGYFRVDGQSATGKETRNIRQGHTDPPA